MIRPLPPLLAAAAGLVMLVGAGAFAKPAKAPAEIVSLLEGGYVLSSLARSVAARLSRM